MYLHIALMYEQSLCYMVYTHTDAVLEGGCTFGKMFNLPGRLYRQQDRSATVKNICQFNSVFGLLACRVDTSALWSMFLCDNHLTLNMACHLLLIDVAVYWTSVLSHLCWTSSHLSPMGTSIIKSIIEVIMILELLIIHNSWILSWSIENMERNLYVCLVGVRWQIGMEQVRIVCVPTTTSPWSRSATFSKRSFARYSMICATMRQEKLQRDISNIH